VTLPWMHRLPDTLVAALSTGFLVHGPTGVGKTAIALRLAYSARAHFKLLVVSCAEIINKVCIVYGV
jgi:transcriptional regulator of aromatic amino acid metabolism